MSPSAFRSPIERQPTLPILLRCLSSWTIREYVLSRLFSTEKPVECWHKHTHLWKGMLGSEEWEGLLHTIRAEVIDGEMQAERGAG